MKVYIIQINTLNVLETDLNTYLLITETNNCVKEAVKNTYELL